MAGPNLIAITTSHDGQVAKQFIQEKGHSKYQFYDLPDDPGANCLYLNNTIVHASSDWLPATCKKFEELHTSAKKIALSGSELNKVDGCFSCSSVLIK
jgi:dimethylargininase